MGVPVRRHAGAAAGAGLQGHAQAGQLPGAVGPVAGGRGQPGAQAPRGPGQLPQGRPPVPAQVVLLQVCLSFNFNSLHCTGNSCLQPCKLVKLISVLFFQESSIYNYRVSSF